MKKKLEAELISIAHRILKLKNKEDVRELHHEAQKLYEKLSVLVFVEENFESIKPTIGQAEIEEKLESFYDSDIAEKEETVATQEPEEVILPIKDEPKIVTTLVEEVPEEITEEPSILTNTEEIAPEVAVNELEPVIEIPKPDKKQISFDEILNSVTPEPIFERVSDKKKDAPIPNEIAKIIEDKIETIEEKKTEELPEITTDFIPEFKEVVFEKASESKENKATLNLNDMMTKNATLTLNDRVAFEQNLFDGSTEDLNRVISQIATFDKFEEAKEFIEEMVKPDYNFWKGKDEFANRFMEFVESKFV